ncbi:hypothetical protein [Stenomitos frigidus]|uniref:hypothetical protein n=1 Tax=Stenomitos frigidus TaxID=1886765 RepID=UPI001FEB7294|nr:hypothetical protein [Stenomitos frigidus]
MEKPRIDTALIDTGFTGFLSLPASIITELNLPWTTAIEALLTATNRTTTKPLLTTLKRSSSNQTMQSLTCGEA